MELSIKKEEHDHIIEGEFWNEFNSYPIIDGIPRFVNEKNYTNSFGFQWGKWPLIQFESKNIGKPMEGHTRKMFNVITHHKLNDIKNKNLLLDCGCGAGRFIDICLENSNSKIIGIDYSSSVTTAHYKFSQNSNVCIVNADALNMPFKPNIFDGAFSIGVLHHTPEPNKGVSEIYRCLKYGGWFGLSVYSKGSYYDKKILKKYRRIFNLLKPVFNHYPPLFYSYFAVYVVKPVYNKVKFLRRRILKLFPFVNLPDSKWSILDTFDSISPVYASTHKYEEILGWVQFNGFKNIIKTHWGNGSLFATKDIKNNKE